MVNARTPWRKAIGPHSLRISATARTVTCGGGAPGAQRVVVQGVTIPYLGLEALIASKETYREQDAIGPLRLLALQKGR